MMAAIEIGGKQYLVVKGQKLSVEKTDGQPGGLLKLDRVLMLADGSNTKLGQPHLDQAVVEAKILRQYRGPKVTVLKYKPKVRYRKKYGHRQSLTEVEITKIA